MNKRQRKKIARKKAKNRWENEFESNFYADGNNGGDFIEIHKFNDDSIRLRSGHCCVMSIDMIVPNEFLPAIIQQVMLNNNCDIERVIDSFNWPKDFTDQLKLRVIKWNS